jgi:uncharacterized protein
MLTTFARALVDQPRRVSVSERQQGGTTVLALSVAADDRGKVIGKEGRTANALRTVLDAVARRQDRRVQLEIMG